VKIVVMRQPLTQLLQWGRRLLLVCAGLLLGYCGYVLADARIFQYGESRTLERQLHDEHTFPNSSPGLVTIAAGGLIGRLEIPRLGLSVIVIEGEDRSTLRRAAGHISGTALPGQAGNVGISAHRDTFFRPLRNIRRNDLITITTLQGEFRYRVVSTRVVSPDDIAVLDSTGGEILTLVTCHPFYFVGPAPNRFIIRAERLAGAHPNTNRRKET
jgi:sortase A